MKEKIKIIYPICITVLIILGVAFYWYEWRPAQIRKECIQLAIQGKSSKFLNSDNGFDANKFANEYLAKSGQQEAIDAFYRNCLREKGISE